MTAGHVPGHVYVNAAGHVVEMTELYAFCFVMSFNREGTDTPDVIENESAAMFLAKLNRYLR